MRFCQMLLNGGKLDGIRLLRDETVRTMTTNQIGHAPLEFGFGVAVTPDSAEVHQQLRASYAWAGFWSTSFRVSPRGDWAIVTMTQRAWDDASTPAWHAKYDSLAAEAVSE